MDNAYEEDDVRGNVHEERMKSRGTVMPIMQIWATIWTQKIFFYIPQMMKEKKALMTANIFW